MKTSENEMPLKYSRCSTCYERARERWVKLEIRTITWCCDDEIFLTERNNFGILMSLALSFLKSYEKMCKHLHLLFVTKEPESVSRASHTWMLYLCKVRGRSSQTCVNYLPNWFLTYFLHRCDDDTRYSKFRCSSSSHIQMRSDSRKRSTLACVKLLSFIQWNCEWYSVEWKDEWVREARTRKNHVENFELLIMEIYAFN